eukprot:1817316-Lingulodinium_polyedra.AAC.1
MELIAARERQAEAAVVQARGYQLHSGRVTDGDALLAVAARQGAVDVRVRGVPGVGPADANRV